SAGLPGAALPLGLLIGLCANACVAGLYALAPSLYDASVRATGVGWGIGVGRGGAILSPLVAGLLLDDGWQPLSLYGALATPRTEQRQHGGRDDEHRRERPIEGQR
ncbi:hypothetical protein QM304_32735, partial [Pseudomonas aeruginosa]|nr:hypothetical protein [Pseudomonas aeruginosa]